MGLAGAHGASGSLREWGPGAKPLNRGSGGLRPPEADHIFSKDPKSLLQVTVCQSCDS